MSEESSNPPAPSLADQLLADQPAHAAHESLVHAAHADEKHAAAKVHATYADAGVDITSGDRAKQRIKMLARKTFNKHVLSEIGGFGGLFALDLEKFPQPVLVRAQTAWAPS